VSQSRYMTDSEYLEKFRTQLDVLASAGGDICMHDGMARNEESQGQVQPKSKQTPS
jgi:hypothetical protein